MIIKRVEFNNRKKHFEVVTSKQSFQFPYAKTSPRPRAGNYVRRVFIDKQLGKEAFTYVLESGEEGTIHVDHVLEVNQEPEYMIGLLSYNLSLAVQKSIKNSAVSKREMIRRLETSPSQFYRLLDPNQSGKSISQKLAILHMLDCDVELIVKDKSGKPLVDCVA
jgi:hypothetical protein